MKAKQRFLAAGLILAAVLATGIASGQTWQATAGLTGADVGLDENRLGVALGAFGAHGEEAAQALQVELHQANVGGARGR